jgi:predicted LPLAT superfamily acyltransferase
MDVRLLYIFSSVFVVPVCLFRPSCGIIYRYFRQRFGYSPWKAFWKTYINHCQFAQVVIDRFAMYAGKQFDITTDGLEHINRLSQRPEGFILMSSHVGNYELAGYTLTSEQKVLNALVFYGEKASVMENRNKMFSRHNIRMIAIREDMGHLFEINNALANGEIVSTPADRSFGSPKTLAKTFLGAEAHFPQGPFSMAAMRGADVLAINVMKVSWHRYHVVITPLDYDRHVSRKQQTDQLSDAYVAELERIVRRYPTQWYNYYEFWT